MAVRRTSNAITIGSLTVWKKGRGPFLSLEVWSGLNGTTVSFDVLSRHGVVVLPVFRSRVHVTRVSARRWYR